MRVKSTDLSITNNEYYAFIIPRMRSNAKIELPTVCLLLRLDNLGGSRHLCKGKETNDYGTFKGKIGSQNGPGANPRPVLPLREEINGSGRAAGALNRLPNQGDAGDGGRRKDRGGRDQAREPFCKRLRTKAGIQPDPCRHPAGHVQRHLVLGSGQIIEKCRGLGSGGGPHGPREASGDTDARPEIYQ